MPRALWWSSGGVMFLRSEVPLYRADLAQNRKAGIRCCSSPFYFQGNSLTTFKAPPPSFRWRTCRGAWRGSARNAPLLRSCLQNVELVTCCLFERIPHAGPMNILDVCASSPAPEIAQLPPEAATSRVRTHQWNAPLRRSSLQNVASMGRYSGGNSDVVGNSDAW